jgi:hypothetical protein
VLPLVHTRVNEYLGITGEFVCHDHINIGAHVLSNLLCQSSRLGIFGMEEPEITLRWGYQ